MVRIFNRTTPTQRIVESALIKRLNNMQRSISRAVEDNIISKDEGELQEERFKIETEYLLWILYSNESIVVEIEMEETITS